MISRDLIPLWKRGIDGDFLQPRPSVILQGGQIAFRQAKLSRLKQAPHDLAAARLGHAVAEIDLARRHGGAQTLARVAEQFFA